MAKPKAPPPTLQLVAVFSRHEQAVQWAMKRIETNWGEIGLKSEIFDHSETNYYAAEMGEGLQKQFAIVSSSALGNGFYDPAKLAVHKLQSNQWELELAENANYPSQRPVNIDPGYLTLTKLVLASAKDRAHRIYLSDGIYAEESLYYLDRRWQSRPWTYPDYQRKDFHTFFEQAREFLKDKITESNRSTP
ncbi:MAG: DUF4416 family protein [Planctomycetota bacterium]